MEKVQVSKVLLLNGELNSNQSLSRYTEAVERVLRRRDINCDTILLREHEISDCKGCFHCWIKTPGICIIDDYSRMINKLFVQADLAVLLSPLTFGGYSSELKKALDRIIPVISPYFTTIDGETHHRKRYQKYPSLVGVGFTERIDQEEKSTFSDLVQRNSINMHSAFQGSLIMRFDQDPRELENQFEALLQKAGV